MPHEQLVNVGGHVAGSESFELVSWSQGLVRHNFLSGNGTNKRSSGNRLARDVPRWPNDGPRVQFASNGSSDGRVQTFGTTSAARVYYLRQKLAAIQEELQNEHLEAALEAAYGVKLKSNNAADLLAAAERVGNATFRLAEGNDGSDLAAIDAHLPAESAYKN